MTEEEIEYRLAVLEGKLDELMEQIFQVEEIVADLFAAAVEQGLVQQKKKP